MEWISVDDRLPEYLIDVLCYYKADEKNHIDIDWLDYDNTFCYTGFGDVTHWMPLPEPPKVGDK